MSNRPTNRNRTPARLIPAGRFLFACLIALLCAVTPPRPAAAHGYLVRSIPQDQTTVSRAPSQVQLWFSEPLEPRFSTIGVFDQNGAEVDLGGSVAPQDHERITAKLPPKLPDGAYIVRFRLAFASDGHVVADRIIFWVGAQTGTIASGGATQSADPFEVLARALSLIGALVLFGTTTLYLIVLRPAWRNSAYAAGGLAPRIMRALYLSAGVAIGVGLIGHLVWLFQQSSALFGVGLGTVIVQGLWNVTMTGTTFGGVWVLRVLFLILGGTSLYAAWQIGLTRPRWVWPLWIFAASASALCLLTFSLGAHAAGSTLWTPFSVFVDWLHLIANGLWIGGLVALTWTLSVTLRTLDGDSRRLALLAALRRFSRLAAAGLLLTIASGAYSAFANVYTPAQMVDTTYGLTLTAKIVLIMPLLIVGWLHNRAVRPDRFEAARDWIERSLRIEAMLGVAVIVIAGLLSATPPPVPATARASAVLPTFMASDGNLALSLSLNPGTIGANAYDIQLSRNGQPVDNARIVLTFVYPDDGVRADPIVLDAAGGGEYSGAGGELDRVGNWQALFDVTLPGHGTLAETSEPYERLALTFPATDQVDQAAARTPSIFNWLTVLILLGIAFGGLRRLLRGPIQRRTIRLDPQFIVIGVAAIVLTVIVLIGGELLISSAGVGYAQSANPTPIYRNPILPDQASIEAGSQIFQNTCAACHSVTSDSIAMPGAPSAPQAAFSVGGYVTSHSDAGLYSFLLGSSSHPYGNNLAEADRWALLNYLRVAFAPADAASPTPTETGSAQTFTH